MHSLYSCLDVSRDAKGSDMCDMDKREPREKWGIDGAEDEGGSYYVRSLLNGLGRQA